MSEAVQGLPLRRRVRPCMGRKRSRERWKRLIEEFTVGGHSPVYMTQTYEHGSETTIACKNCELKYRGRLWSRWWGLSSRRPCRGNNSV